MNYFRIVRREHAETPFGYGTGAARWNTRHVPMIYAGSSIALCMTEYLCIKGASIVVSQWSLITFRIDGEIPMLETDHLPLEWSSRPYPLDTQLFGNAWIRNNTSVCLRVPSARLPLFAYPSEHNLLINPFHPGFLQTVKVAGVEDLDFQL